jgi:hypothetical protein
MVVGRNRTLTGQWRNHPDRQSRECEVPLLALDDMAAQCFSNPETWLIGRGDGCSHFALSVLSTGGSVLRPEKVLVNVT